MSKRIASVLLLALCLFGAAPCAAMEDAGTPLPQIPREGRVTMLNIGVKLCLSCQRMASIIDELEKEYGDKAAIVYVDLPLHREVSDKYGLRTIPTQIFFDRDGKERFRHEGYLSKKRCVGYLEKLGLKK